MQKTNIDHNTGIWIGDELHKMHKFDKGLCKSLCDFFEENGGNVVDLGCGYGQYVEKISEITECFGYDGNPYTESITNGLCKVVKLHEPLNYKRKTDWVLSLEVGNHIPEKYEDVFINNIHKTCGRGIIISWATTHQGGRFQFNKRNNDYIINKFQKLGYTYDSKLAYKFRNDSSCLWFKKSLMVFMKK
tara:strand:- start:350 stop:916 length:567 start_codon:yes stop_codon:yes gene_type:complete